MQQENDPKHTSKSPSEWLKKNEMKVLECSTQDLRCYGMTLNSQFMLENPPM